MPGTTPSGKKIDESDFEFQIEDMESGKDRKHRVEKGRVLDVPTRHKSVPVGSGQTKSIVICFHGKLITHPCAACDFEAPKLLEESRS